MTSFFCDEAAEDDEYNVIRDKPRFSQDKAFIEEMWLQYKPYADRHFLLESRKNFKQRIWEMYLTCSLIAKGFSITSDDKGPDIRILKEGVVIWIEAVAPKAGEGNDAVTELQDRTTRRVPDDQIKLRYRSAIGEKYNKKYQKYILNQIVKPNDCYIIAINGSAIPSAKRETEIPRIIRSVLPFGNETLIIDVEKHELLDRSYEYQDQVSKVSGSSVSTDIFLNNQYDGISAVLYSCVGVDSLNSPQELGDDFVLLHNPLAKNKLERGLIKLGREYWVENPILECTNWVNQ
ncbi:MAG: hypothetical protein RM347_004710 [Nostoc sp. ChiQUE02]|uniref:hypothetical protein n=1 Tax=Nostoc sp. ChiQUE02 TaxID=3075377 RepID=UPI002AD35A7C|nr:hypothetical protein [Nostoc sp. ChiQUE02]MDZ8234635.1 hypothetical protein [Nostoc sp. ChiQUE02]